MKEIHIPLTHDTKQSKGAAFVRFVHASDAIKALTLCHGAIFMGRLLKVRAVAEDPYSIKADSNTFNNVNINSNNTTNGKGVVVVGGGKGSS